MLAYTAYAVSVKVVVVGLLPKPTDFTTYTVPGTAYLWSMKLP